MCEILCHPGSAVPFVLSPARRTPKLTRLLGLLLMAVVCGGLAPRLAAQVPTPVTVPTWRYDLTHAGQNTNETALTPANVNESTFGKLFSQTVDGSVYAQPLYVPSLTMGDRLVHNVLFVAPSMTRSTPLTRIRIPVRMQSQSGRLPCWMQLMARARARPLYRVQTPGIREISDRRSALPGRPLSILRPTRCMWLAKPRRAALTSTGYMPSIFSPARSRRTVRW